MRHKLHSAYGFRRLCTMRKKPTKNWQSSATFLVHWRKTHNERKIHNAPIIWQPQTLGNESFLTPTYLVRLELVAGSGDRGQDLNPPANLQCGLCLDAQGRHRQAAPDGQALEWRGERLHIASWWRHGTRYSARLQHRHRCSQNTSNRLPTLVKPWAVATPFLGVRTVSEAYLRCVEALAGLCGFQIT